MRVTPSQKLPRDSGESIFAARLGISPAIYRARNPEKSEKNLPTGVWDPQTPDPQKVPKKVRKVQKIVDFTDFFRNFSGVRVGGSQTPPGRFFFQTFRGFWLCRWSGRSQREASRCLAGPSGKELFDFQGRHGITSIVRWNLYPVVFSVKKALHPGNHVGVKNPWRHIWRVAGRESGSPELLESPWTSLEVPPTSPEAFRRLPRKFSHCGT